MISHPIFRYFEIVTIHRVEKLLIVSVEKLQTNERLEFFKFSNR